MSKLILQPDLTTVLPLLHHLCYYGEASTSEITALQGENWLPLLEQARVITIGRENQINAVLGLMQIGLENDNQLLIRWVFFRNPAYRNRLLAILAHGLVDAAQKNLLEELENWVVRDIPSLAREINNLLDMLETDFANLVALPPGETIQRFKPLFDGFGDTAKWDLSILGHNGEPQNLFGAVLEKFGKQVLPEDTTVDTDFLGQKTLALLPYFSLITSDGRLRVPDFTPWTTARSYVYSSLPLFDSNGHPLFDVTNSPETIWQDALAQQPFYRALIHLAYAERLGIGEKDQIQLFCDPSDFGGLYLESNARIIGRLADLLPDLVAALGFYPVWSNITAVGQIETMIFNLLAANILIFDQGHLILDENYALSLNLPPRVGQIGRGQGRIERQAIMAALQPAS